MLNTSMEVPKVRINFWSSFSVVKQRKVQASILVFQHLMSILCCLSLKIAIAVHLEWQYPISTKQRMAVLLK